MSKKVSHKSSMTNRPTCGGPRKAGLAPRSTNFMMGVKKNHHFSGKPFAGKAADYPPECRMIDNNTGSGNGLGSGSNSVQITLQNLVESGIVNVDGNVYTLNNNYTLEKNTTLQINSGETLNIPTDKTFTNNGTIDNGYDSNYGGIINNEVGGTINNEVGGIIMTTGAADFDYDDQGDMKNKGVINNTGTIYGSINNHNGGKINNNSGGLFTGVEVHNWPGSELYNNGLILFADKSRKVPCPVFDGYKIDNCRDGSLKNIGGIINNDSSGIIDSRDGVINNGVQENEDEDQYYNNADDYIDGEYRNSVINNLGTISNMYCAGGCSVIRNNSKGIINNQSGDDETSGEIHNGGNSYGGIFNHGSIVNCGTISGYEIEPNSPEDCPPASS